MIKNRQKFKKRPSASQQFMRKLGILCIAFLASGLSFAQTYTFTNAGASGKQGPSQAQVTAAYSSTNLAGTVAAIDGIQYWIIPSTGLYQFDITGASGGGNSGGMGANASAEFLLTGGDTLMVIVGQMGMDGTDGSTTGGGGTFVVVLDATSSYVTYNGLRVRPLLIAGGGGGNSGTSNSTTDASLNTSGATATGNTGFGAGGTNGNGGSISVSSGNSRGGAGGGFLTDGERTNTCGAGGLESGYSFLNGGEGGESVSCSTPYPGGFGGGGGAISSGWRGAGGGGGYSGGGAGQTNSVATTQSGGGGSSFSSGNNSSFSLASSAGHGIIEISTLSSGAFNDVGVISIDSPTVYCSGAHPVVVTVQNFGINIVDSLILNWSVDGVAQSAFKYVGVLDTIGGSGSATKQLNIGTYSFTSAAHLVKVWTSSPNGGNDTSVVNDTATASKQANLPPPTNLTSSNLNATNAVLLWNAGSLANTWAYVNSTSSTTPTGPGTIVSNDSVYLTGLTERTDYYFFVREICASGDSSSWAGPYHYKTPCANILNGTYTIDPSQAASSTNFVTISGAVDALKECGVSGAVDFLLSAGTFNESVEIPEISGVSATNLVRFIGTGKSTTTISNSGTGTANWVTVMLDGADYIEFRDLTIRAAGSSYGIGIMFTNTADHNAFRNVDVFTSTSSTSTNFEGIVWSGSKTSYSTAGDNGNFDVLDSVYVTGGYYAIRIYGISSAASNEGNQVLNSRAEDYYYYGIYGYYNADLVVDNCYINTNRNTNADGLYTGYLANPILTNNTIHVQDYGLYATQLNPAATYDKNKPTIIGNNKIVSTGDYGVYIPSNGGDLRFVQNSVNVSSGYAVRMNGGSDIVMLNNHIRNYRTSANSYALYTTAGFDTLDYNNYESLGSGNQFYFGGTGYSDFASYQADQAFFGYEENSYNQDPNFISNTDLHIDQSVINLRGLFTGFYFDADGDERCEFAPTLGADESYFATPAPSADIALDDTIYISSPTTFYSAFQPLAGVLLDYTWYIDNVQSSKEENFMKAFAATGTHEIKLRVRSCVGFGRDSVMVTVVNPSSVPSTDFTASKLIVDVLEESQLSDLSDFGATQWEWTAEPSFDAIFSDAYVSNPTVVFLSSGSYKICLTTANGVGQGNKLCKDAYISVNDDQMMCSGSESSVSAGRLTDEGGVSGNYTANSNCNFVIRPCAGTVNLKFTEWDLSDADDILRVYEGEDNTGSLLGTFTGNSNVPGGASGLVSSTGKMYIEWRTNGSGQSAGFTAYWSTTPDLNATVPDADFSVPDSIFIGQEVSFRSTTPGNILSYLWDFDPPFAQSGLDGGKDESDRYVWSTAGSYPIELTVTTCGGTDTENKTIQVFSPTTAPVVGFYASRTKVPVLTTITLMDSSFQGGTSYKWSISPAITANILGADDEKELSVSFIKSGKYTVKLLVANSVGADSLIKVDYIDVFDYCTPVVGSPSSDVAISRVMFGGIDNYSSVGVDKYNNYLNDFPAEKVALRDSIEIHIERQSVTDPLNRKVWVDWNNDGDFDDAGEEVASEASNSKMSYTTKFVVPQNAAIGYTTLRVGVSYDQDVNRPCGINPTGEFEDYPLQVIIDDQIPVISLIGQDTVWVEKGYQYMDAGAIALDNIDGDISSMINVVNTVDSSVVGTYSVKYNVTDMDGNVAVEVLRVVYVTPDVTAPVITLIGPASMDIRVGTSYTDSGATAEDYYLIDLTGQMQQADNVDLNVIGTYHVWFTVEDASGNKDSVAREVNIIDDVAPILTLVGNNPLTVEVNAMFNDPGYTVTDNYYANVTVIVDSSMVEMNKVGEYTVTYTATDSSGNTTMLTRTVRVDDTTLPTLELIGADTIIVDVFGSYIELGAQVQDNYCTQQIWSVDQTPDLTLLGDYTLSYTTEDCNGNISLPVTRLVRVVDREAPVIRLNGFAANTVYRWEGFSDPGVSIDDNYYSEANLQADVVITSNFDPNWVGFYSICYQVTDSSGNKSHSACRTIQVVESITSIEGVEETNYSIYPNPSKGKFTIAFNEVLHKSTTIKVYDLAGKLVYETSATAGLESMPISVELAKGMYHVAISSDDNHQVIPIQILD